MQNQQKIEWPSKLVVAKAYVDQLSRSQALPADKIAALQKAIQSAESSHMSKDALAKLKGMASSLAKDAGAAKRPGRCDTAAGLWLRFWSIPQRKH